MNGRWVVGGLLVALVLAPAGMGQELGPGSMRERQLGWDWQAESAFRIGRGLAPQLMTEAQWREHQARMQAMTPEDRRQYRTQMHAQMVERAEALGLTSPARPAQPRRSWWPFGRGRSGGRGGGGR